MWGGIISIELGMLPPWEEILEGGTVSIESAWNLSLV